MTYEAKRAVSEIHRNNWKLLHTISDQSDQSLRAFRQLVGEKQMEYAELPGDNMMAALYGGFAAAADGELASRARWRNSKGTWYAVVTIYRNVSKGVSETAAEFSRKCEGKKVAIAAARELLAEHASKFDAGISVEADIFPDGEWSPAA